MNTASGKPLLLLWLLRAVAAPRLRPVATDEAGRRRLLDAVLLLLDEARRKGILP